MTYIPIVVAVMGIAFMLDLAISVGAFDHDEPSSIRILTAKSRYNKLKQCSKRECEKLSRGYQRKLYYARHGENCCPHCKSFAGKYSYRTIKDEKWMRYHQDCIKLTTIQCIQMKLTTMKLTKKRKEMGSLKFYEEYNSLNTDFKWIENLSEKK